MFVYTFVLTDMKRLVLLSQVNLEAQLTLSPPFASNKSRRGGLDEM